MKVAFAGAFAVRLEERVRAHLTPAHVGRVGRGEPPINPVT
jgi:hypothetical protein